MGERVRVCVRACVTGRRGPQIVVSQSGRARPDGGDFLRSRALRETAHPDGEVWWLYIYIYIYIYIYEYVYVYIMLYLYCIYIYIARALR